MVLAGNEHTFTFQGIHLFTVIPEMPEKRPFLHILYCRLASLSEFKNTHMLTLTPFGFRWCGPLVLSKLFIVLHM